MISTDATQFRPGQTVRSILGGRAGTVDRVVSASRFRIKWHDGTVTTCFGYSLIAAEIGGGGEDA